MIQFGLSALSQDRWKFTLAIGGLLHPLDKFNERYEELEFHPVGCFIPTILLEEISNKGRISLAS
jgi:hypothetical protein